MRGAAELILTGALVVGFVACGGDGSDGAAPGGSGATAAPPPAAEDLTPTPTAALPPSTAPIPVPAPPAAPAAPVPGSSAPPAPPPPATLPPLPMPVGAPVEDGTDEETFEVAFLEIPEIGLATPVLEGIRMSTLDRAPGHWPGTALPGQLGNVVVAAHRTSHDAEFRDLDELEPGDEVIMSTLAGRFVYHVRAVEIVAPEALWIVDQTYAHTATLFACHPPGSIRQRIVAHLELTV